MLSERAEEDGKMGTDAITDEALDRLEARVMRCRETGDDMRIDAEDVAPLIDEIRRLRGDLTEEERAYLVEHHARFAAIHAEASRDWPGRDDMETSAHRKLIAMLGGGA